MRFIKETIGILVIILLIILLEIITGKITNTTFNMINNHIEYIEKEESKTEMNKKIEELSRTWKKEKVKLFCYIEHKQLEDIGENINLLVFNSKYGNKESIKENLSMIKFKIDYIRNSQKLKLENIF